MATADVCVICNPSAGRGRARQRLLRFRRVLGARVELRPTRRPGHAEELALQAAREGFATVVAAGGDGTVHEVANGLVRAGPTTANLAVLPIGSANDYAVALGLDADWWMRPDAAVGPGRVDVGVARSGGQSRYFVNGLGLGFNGAVTREARRIRGLQGVPLYGVALLQALCFHFTHPMMTVRLDDDPPRTGPTLALSLALGRREGNFVVAPDARLDDGLFDYVHAGALTRRSLLGFVPGLITGRLPTHPAVARGRCRRATLHSEAPLTVHLDGEFFCLEEDGLHDLEVELLPGALGVFRRTADGEARPGF
jgi:diacylglycerol kinase family enzyme